MISYCMNIILSLTCVNLSIIPQQFEGEKTNFEGMKDGEGENMDNPTQAW